MVAQHVEARCSTAAQKASSRPCRLLSDDEAQRRAAPALLRLRFQCTTPSLSLSSSSSPSPASSSPCPMPLRANHKPANSGMPSTCSLRWPPLASFLWLSLVDVRLDLVVTVCLRAPTGQCPLLELLRFLDLFVKLLVRLHAGLWHSSATATRTHVIVRCKHRTCVHPPCFSGGQAERVAATAAAHPCPPQIRKKRSRTRRPRQQYPRPRPVAKLSGMHDT